MYYSIWYTDWLFGEEIESDFVVDDETDKRLLYTNKEKAEEYSRRLDSEFKSTRLIELEVSNEDLEQYTVVV